MIQLDIKVQNLEHKMCDLQSIDRAVTEINTTLKALIKTTEKREELYEEQAKALSKLANQMESISNKLENTDKNLSELSQKVNDNIKSGSISFHDIFKKSFWYILAVGIGWLMFKLGIKG